MVLLVRPKLAALGIKKLCVNKNKHAQRFYLPGKKNMLSTKT